MNEEDDFSCTVSLERGPLEIDKWAPEHLQKELEERIPALLQSYQADNTMEGWRDVALQLALTYHPAFKIKQKKKLPVSGRPTDVDAWSHRSMVRTRAQKLRAEAELTGADPRVGAEAARQVHTELKRIEDTARSRARGKDQKGIGKTPSVKRLENLASQTPAFPEEFKSQDTFFETFLLASKVASKL